MLCRVDGPRASADALPSGVSSGCFATILIYDFTSLLASKVLCSLYLVQLAMGLLGGGSLPSCFLLFICVGDFVGNP